MACRLVSPALIADAAECCGLVNPIVWSIVKHQLAHGESWALRDEQDRALVIVGAFPNEGWPDGGWREAWFITSPLAAQRPLAVIRAARLTMSDPQYRGIRAVIVTHDGRRIAKAAGFTFFGWQDGLEIWER